MTTRQPESTPRDTLSKAVGAERFSTDQAPPDCLWAGARRAGVPHARILAVHADQARAVPGVAAVLTGTDVPGSNRQGIVHKDQPVLATDTVRHAGDAVALVLAENEVALARALALRPDVLLLDEPTTFLDVTHQVEVLDLLTDLNQSRGTTIVMVLHDINLAARYADYLFAVRQGELIAHGAPREILTRELVKDVFGLDAVIITDPVSGAPLVLPKGRHHVTSPEFAGV